MPTSPSHDLARVTALFLAPLALGASLLAHPFLAGRLPNESAIADAVVAGPTRWAWVHLAAAVASALVVVAFLALRGYLRGAGDDRSSAIGVPFVVLGSTLFAVLPGMEFAPLAVVETGGSAAEIGAAQDAIGGWFVLVLVAGALSFTVGTLFFAAALLRTHLVGERLTYVVVTALVVMAASRFVPLAAVQFYVQSAAALVAMWPLAYVLWERHVPVAGARSLGAPA